MCTSTPVDAAGALDETPNKITSSFPRLVHVFAPRFVPCAAIPAAAALVFSSKAAAFTPLHSVSRSAGVGSRVGASPASKKSLGTLSGRPDVSSSKRPSQHVCSCCPQVSGAVQCGLPYLASCWRERGAFYSPMVFRRDAVPRIFQDSKRLRRVIQQSGLRNIRYQVE